MRVLEIVSANDINGAVTHVLQLYRQLERRGHEVYLACPPHAWIRSQVPSSRVVPTTMQRWPLDEARRIAAWIRKRGIDVTHTHQSRAHSFGVLLRWLYGVPSVATAHNCRVQLHWALNNQVIGVSDRTTRFHRRFNLVSRRRSQTIHNFVDTTAFADADGKSLRADWMLDATHCVGVVIGSVMQKKGLHVLVESLTAVLKQVPQFRLVVAGQPRPRDADYAGELKRRCAELNLNSHVTWLGPREDIPQVLAASDLLISASLEENFPISMLEAMAAKRAIVATSVGGVPECVLPNETGLLAPPNDSPRLAQSIIAVAGDAALRERLATAGWDRVHSHFSAESQTPRIEAVARSGGWLARIAVAGDSGQEWFGASSCLMVRCSA